MWANAVWSRNATWFLAVWSILLAGSAINTYAQTYPSYQGYTPYYSQPYTPPPPPVAPPFPNSAPAVPGPPVMATPQLVAPLTPAQIDQLVAPIALYPDPLLAQLLPASTYPLQVALAAQWLQYNPNPGEILIEMQNWDASIKAMVHYPTVLAYMNANLQWTQALGVAFLNQQADVMQAIQRLRAQALAAGTLQSTPQQQIISENGLIWIEPANPLVIYVPLYDPYLVYSRPTVIYSGPYLTFSIGFVIGTWLNNSCDWHNKWIITGRSWHPYWRRDSRGQWIRNHPIYPGNNQRPGPARSLPVRWTRNPREPLPALPPNVAQPGAVRQYLGWPGHYPVNRPAPPFRPANIPGGFRPQPPPGVFGGIYRSDNNAIRAENRGRQSLQTFRNQVDRGAVPRPEYRAPQPLQRQAPSAFQGMNSNRHTQQDSQRGRQSMGRR